MTKRITVQFPDWMIESIIGQDNDNQAERIRELVQKGSMVETLEDATGQSFKQLVRGRAQPSDTTSSPDDSGGIGCHALGDSHNQWSEFIYNNPWTAKQLGDSKS